MIVAILEDVPEQASILAEQLRRVGHIVRVRHDGDRFLDLMRSDKLDLLLLDWDVPGTPGIEVARIARGELPDTPIIMLTQHDSEADIVAGLNNGADDYLIKPVGGPELLARIEAQKRRYYPAVLQSDTLTIGRFTLDRTARNVRAAGIKGDTDDGCSLDEVLPEREFKLLDYLFSNSGALVKKEDLVAHIWGSEPAGETAEERASQQKKYYASLSTYISTLRRVLHLRPKNGIEISTIYNYGYRLRQIQ
ncbi:response regulator transcription factor [Trinickia mobilis]|uniref:response regulator transcription factor n=1 Tax=Trinickia mobilis TaxID=2816356 RepID=UPI001A8D9789|nr:response regulator transcription factor [Trinickia mobilis]